MRDKSSRERYITFLGEACPQKLLNIIQEVTKYLKTSKDLISDFGGKPDQQQGKRMTALFLGVSASLASFS